MNILYTTCFLDVSGVTKVNLDILVGISSRFKIYVCETVNDAKLSAKLENHFRDRFGEPFKLWRVCANERYRYFIAYLKDNAIDLVFNTHSLWVYEHVAQLKRDLPRLKIVDSLHVLEPYCFRGGYPDISANQFVHPFINKSIVISEHLLSYIMRYYSVDSGKFIVIRNGIDTDQFRRNSALTGVFKAEIGVHVDIPLIGFIGRFSRQKRPDIFLKVAKCLTKQFDQVYFYMVGGGELVDKSKKLAGELGITDLVRFVPPRDDVHLLLNSTDILLVTSSYEGAPLTILEALATGVPVVSYDVGAIGEYIGSEWLSALGKGEVDRLAEMAVKRLQAKVTQLFDSDLYGKDKLICNYMEIFETCRESL